MSIQVTGVNEVTREITRIMKTVTGPEMKYQVAMAGSPYVLMKYNYFTYPNKQNRQIHYFYGEAVWRGNWAESIEELSFRRKRLRTAGYAAVGPRYNVSSRFAARAGKERRRIVGSNMDNSWANYAHMIYGSARAYYQKITVKVLTASAPMALPAMLAESKRIFELATGKKAI